MKIRNHITTALICSVVSGSPLALAGTLTVEGGKEKLEAEDVQGVSYGVASPRDAASGQATGRRQHKPFCVSLVPSAGTPFWFSTIATGQTLKTVTVEHGGIRFKLTNASVSELTFSDTADKDWQRVCFVFQGIEVSHPKSGKTATDSPKSDV